MAKLKKKESISAPLISAPSPKKILGLDLSLTGTGWVLDDNLTLTSGLIDTDKMEGLDRMDHILKNIMNLIVHPNGWLSSDFLVVVEDFSFASKGASLFQIAGLGYLIRHWLWTEEIPYKLVAPTMLKKFASGTGNCDKNVILKEIYKRWGADINDDNIGDAYVLSRIGRAQAGWDEANTLTAFQAAVMLQLEKSNA